MKKKIIFPLFILALVGAEFFCLPAAQIKYLNNIIKTVKAENLININAAEINELDALPGIGEIKAQAIIDYRETNGSFSSIEDIINVSGIGDVTYENIKNLITTESSDQSQETPAETDEQADPSATTTPQEDADSATEHNNENSPQELIETENDESVIFYLGDVLINEFVSDPTDGEEEWVELFCALNQEINLSGWIIEEGSGAKTTINNKNISQNNYIIIEKPKGNLNNKGDIIFLRDNTGKLIDKIAYGNWENNSFNSNAPAADDPKSTARKINGQTTYNNFNDFAVTLTPTKGQPNIITPEKEDEAEISQQELADYDYSKNIEITELLPNPDGRDTEQEFFELYNTGKTDINLNGWRLGDESKKRFQFTADASIKPQKYLVVYRSESKLALNNSADSLKLFQPLKDDPFLTIKYTKAIEGWSYALDNSKTNRWAWTETITPGEENQIKSVNHAPQVDFDCPANALVGEPVLFDSSDTIDGDEDELNFFWNFGDNATNTLAIPQHTYLKAGSYSIVLRVSDYADEAKKEKIIHITNSEKNKNINFGSSDEKVKIIINEILPDPEGSDRDGEWIEIFNNGEARINLLNFRLDDIEGGSRPYTFIDEFYLDAGKYFVIDRADSGLALNNTNESVRLFDPDGELLDKIEYEKAFTGETYARGQNNKWFWTTALTPGENNIISVADSESILKIADYSNGQTASTKKKIADTIIETTLEKIRDLEIGDAVKVKGKVAVLPGILGAQYFYIIGSPGVQVYNYNKNFPDLLVGDEIEVTGKLSQSYGEWRLKTKTAEDITVVGSGLSPEPELFNCEQITEDCTGQLISVTGEIVEQTGSNAYIDDGTDEMRIYIKNTTGINAKNLKEGEIATITGIISRTKTGLRLMPRSTDDIIKKDPETSDEIGRVLGEVAASDEWEIAIRDKKLELFKYLLIIASTVIIILIGLLIKLKPKN
ncbi:MAG: lamin tail domain-containing protein [Patescibacteria group bacterium]|nr:lamin tail domain-containing protein [Patescibacteria group bacterium]